MLYIWLQLITLEDDCKFKALMGAVITLNGDCKFKTLIGAVTDPRLNRDYEAVPIISNHLGKFFIMMLAN
jgi:hypothetical protein